MDLSTTSLSQIPAARPPPGKHSNFVDPPSLGTATISVNAVLLSLASTAVLVRIYTKHFLLRHLGWDDHTCVLALLASATHTGLVIYDVQYAQLGKHLWDIPVIKLDAKTVRSDVALSIVYTPAVFLMKLSAFLLQYRLFKVDPTVRYLIYFGIGFQIVYGITVIGVYSVTLAECTGIASLIGSFCPNIWKFVLVQGVLNVVTDIYVLLLPVGVVLRLQVTRARRIGILAIFLTGWVAVAAGVARLVISITTIHSTDLLWGPAMTATFSCCEMNVGLICACMPAMPAFFKTHRLSIPALAQIRRRLSSVKHSNAGSSASTQLAGGKPFRGIAAHITGPSLHMKTRDYVELESFGNRLNQ